MEKEKKVQSTKKTDEGKTTKTSKEEGKVTTTKKTTKNENAKKEEPKVTVKATKEKATKVETKPVNRVYVSSKEAKNPKKGQFGLILLIILIIAVSVFLINTFRKYTILNDLSEKSYNYVTSENYHQVATYDRNFESGDNTKVETYRKGNTVKNVMYSPVRGIITTIYSTTAGSKMFIDGKNGKIMTYDNNNKSLWIAAQPQNMIGDAKLLISMFTGVHSEELEGKKCYVLSGKMLCTVRTGDVKLYKIYVDKETGLPIQIEREENVEGELQKVTTKYSYQFDSVKDENLTAPSDISQYVIQNNTTK